MTKRSLVIVFLCIALVSIIVPSSISWAKNDQGHHNRVYNILNPESWMAPFDAVALNPRLEILSGKTIGIVGQTHQPMLYLAGELLAAVPDIAEIVILEGSWSSRKGLTEEQKQLLSDMGIDAAIQGIGH